MLNVDQVNAELNAARGRIAEEASQICARIDRMMNRDEGEAVDAEEFDRLMEEVKAKVRTIAALVPSFSDSPASSAPASVFKKENRNGEPAGSEKSSPKRAGG